MFCDISLYAFAQDLRYFQSIALSANISHMKKTSGPNYNATIRACFVAYIIQAIVNNFVSLLFVIYQRDYGMPLSQITLLITINFTLQLCIDSASALFIDRIGYRASILIAHAASVLGLVLLAFLLKLISFLPPITQALQGPPSLVLEEEEQTLTQPHFQAQRGGRPSSTHQLIQLLKKLFWQ